MADQNWGNCRKCQYFSLADPNVEPSAVGQCKQKDLKAFALKVSGDSGCNAFEARIEAPESPDATESPALH